MKTVFDLQNRPIINIENLRCYPPGSLGRVWVDALDKQSVKPLNFGPRRLQLHDGLHALLGYGVDHIDEAKVQAFLLGTENRAKPLNGLLLSILVLKVLKKLRKTEINIKHSRKMLFEALKNAYHRGKNSTLNPDTWQAELFLHLPIEEVRAYYHL